MLQSAPSFSVFNVNGETMEESPKEETLTRTVTIGDSITEATDNGDFSFGKNKMGLIEEEESPEDEKEEEGLICRIESLNLEPENEPASSPMFLASGLGIDSFEIGGGFPSNLLNFEESGNLDEDYYKRKIDEYPCHPVFLANYAQILQAKGQLNEAAEYYHRASMADPENGEILMKYAKLEWELHRNKDKALSNFERAIQAAPDNSQVLAAYASFLWEIDEDDEDSATNQESKQLDSSTCDGENVEEYYERMIQEKPCDSSVLRNYARFLYQTKGDLPGAEEYYSRAILADPRDGESKSQYAKLVWENRQDLERASSYFEQAVEAAPEDSNVLAAYARFLWETEEIEDVSASHDQLREASVSVATA